MKRYIYIMMFSLSVLLYNTSYAQIISGPTEVNKDTYVTFSHSLELSGSILSFDWVDLGNGTISDETDSTFTIKWASDNVAKIQLFEHYLKGDILIAEKLVVVGNPSAVEYTYDAVGNRIKREVVILGSAMKSLVNEADLLNKINDELAEERKFRVYPNPARQFVYVSLNDKALEDPNSEIQMFDLTGKLVLQIKSLSEVQQIDMSSLNSGIYILRLVYGQKSKECKIIKQY